MEIRIAKVGRITPLVVLSEYKEDERRQVVNYLFDPTKEEDIKRLEDKFKEYFPTEKYLKIGASW